MESIELLWARSVFALEKAANRIGLSMQQMLVALQSNDSDVISRLGPELFSLVSLTWGYLDEYEKQKCMNVDDLTGHIAWAISLDGWNCIRINNLIRWSVAVRVARHGTNLCVSCGPGR